MNIVRENIDELSALIRVTVNADDYGKAVDAALHNYKKKANIPGFRPGMVPIGIIRKMFGKSVVAEESYRTATQLCFNYIKENNINAIGDVMPSEKQEELDFENQTEFEFLFEIGIAPEINLSLTKRDNVKHYQIEITDDMRESYKANFRRRFGELADVEVIEKDEAVTATLENEDIKAEEAYVGLISLKEEIRNKFAGKKVGDSMEINIEEIYPSEQQRASVLKMKKEELKELKPEFNLTITRIRRFVEPEINEELLTKAFPGGEVKSMDDFGKFVDAQITAELNKESALRFEIDFREFLIKKAKMDLPGDFLKRWVYNINEGKYTMEQIEKDFPQFLDMMRWDLIRAHYAKELEINVTEEEVLAEAKEFTRQQFAQYGMAGVGDDMLNDYAKSVLGNKEENRRLHDKVLDSKVISLLSQKVAVKETPISIEDFGKLFENN